MSAYLGSAGNEPSIDLLIFGFQFSVKFPGMLMSCFTGRPSSFHMIPGHYLQQVSKSLTDMLVTLPLTGLFNEVLTL